MGKLAVGFERRFPRNDGIEVVVGAVSFTDHDNITRLRRFTIDGGSVDRSRKVPTATGVALTGFYSEEI